jgi:hypothetical protein
MQIIEQLVNQIPLPFTFLITVGIVLLSIAIGFGLGGYSRRHNKSDKKPSLGSIIGAMLALLGFILALTFSIASSRFDARKQLVLDEANAIGTAFLRTDFLAEAPRTESRKLLKEYVNIRVEAVQNIEKLPQALVDSEVLQDRLWSQVNDRSNQTQDSELFALYIQSLNEVIDLHSERVTVGLQYRIPQNVWLLLYFVTTLAMLVVGYEFGLNDAGSFLGGLLLAFMFSAIISIVVDLDRSNNSLLVQVSQEPMIELQQKLNSSVN